MPVAFTCGRRRPPARRSSLHRRWSALFSTPHPLEWFLFAALAMLTGSFTLNIAVDQREHLGRRHVPHRRRRCCSGRRRRRSRWRSTAFDPVVAQGLRVAARRVQRGRAGAVAVGRGQCLLPARAAPRRCPPTTRDRPAHSAAVLPRDDLLRAEFRPDGGRGRPRVAAVRRSRSGDSTFCGCRSSYFAAASVGLTA